MYYNTRPKSAPKGITVTCFHPSMNFNTIMGYVIIDNLLLNIYLPEMAFHEFSIVVINYKIVFENVKSDP
jgi:hypothetical protein